MTDREPASGVPPYKVVQSGKDERVRQYGRDFLARVVAIVPQERDAEFQPSENEFRTIAEGLGVRIMPLHKVVDKALLFVLTASEPNPRETLDAAVDEMGAIADIWHNPAEGLRALFPERTEELPPQYQPLIK